MNPQVDRAEIEEVLAYREEANLSYRQLEAETGINRHTLAGWARRIRQESRATDQVDFVEMVVSDECGEDTPIEVVLSGEATIILRRGFDPSTLRQALSILRDPC